MTARVKRNLPDLLSVENADWNQMQKLFFDGRNHKRMWYDPKSHFVPNILKQFIRFARLSKEMRLLEIGCGAGRYMIPLVLDSFKITGLDISDGMLNQLKQDLVKQDHNAEYDFLKGDIDTFDFQDAVTFDAVIGFNILHHLFDPTRSLQKIHGRLKKGGIVAFVEPNDKNPLHSVDSFLDGSTLAEQNRSNSTPEVISEALKNSDFENIEHRRFGFFPPFVVNTVPQLIRLERWLENKSALNKYLAYFMIKAEKG